MGRDLGLANRCRAIGVRNVVEIAGWQTRGSDNFSPRGAVDHNTVGPGPEHGNMPSLGVLINGRADLPGPLCNIGMGRDGTAYIIASGRANHAGPGGWGGLSGNSSVYGLERENMGTDAEPITPEQNREAALILAAMIQGCPTVDPALVCEHHEWTRRKVDAWRVIGSTQRGLVAASLVPGPSPTPPGVPMAFESVAQNADGRWEWFKVEGGALRSSWQIAGQPQPSGWASVDSTQQWNVGSLRAVRGNDGRLNVFGTQVGTDKRMAIWQNQPNGGGWSGVVVYNNP